MSRQKFAESYHGRKLTYDIESVSLGCRQGCLRSQVYFWSSYHKLALTHDDENVPGRAAILAAVDGSMQAGMPALPGHFQSRMREYVTSDECGKSLAHSLQNVILLAKRTTDELIKTVSIQTAGIVKQKMKNDHRDTKGKGSGGEKARKPEGV